MELKQEINTGIKGIKGQGIIEEILFSQPPGLSRLPGAIRGIGDSGGPQAAYNAVLRSEVALGLRKPTLAIYDHTGHMIGGGQKYGFTVAHALKDMFDVTLLVNRPLSHDQLRDWYHLDLTECKIKVIPLPFFDQWEGPHLDPARVNRRTGNPFHAVSRESGNYDFFVNNSMNEKVLPLANVSSLICHFPERRPRDYFYADRYTHVIYNSHYTAHWIRQKWKFSPHKHIYPPVDMEPSDIKPSGKKPSGKKNLVLSVARFEEGGSKKQLEMVYAFIKLNRRYPSLFADWRLVLAGGSPGGNPYLRRIEGVIADSGVQNIRLAVNIPGDELKGLYGDAGIFWHLCGLDQSDPALVEHFGMTIGEAMQNRLAPVVFDGGGQREIVDHGVSGFRVNSTADLMRFTLQLVRDPQLRESIGSRAFEQGQTFHRRAFEHNVRDFFLGELEIYRSGNKTDTGDERE